MQPTEKCYDKFYGSNDPVDELIKDLGICLKNDKEDLCNQKFRYGIYKLNIDLLLYTKLEDYIKCIKDESIVPEPIPESTPEPTDNTVTVTIIVIILIILIIIIIVLTYRKKSRARIKDMEHSVGNYGFSTNDEKYKDIVDKYKDIVLPPIISESQEPNEYSFFNFSKNQRRPSSDSSSRRSSSEYSSISGILKDI